MEIFEEGDKIYTCDTCGCKFKITSDKDLNRYDWVYLDVGFLLSDHHRVYCDTALCPRCGSKVIISWH